MSVTTSIIFAVVLYAAFRAAIRPRKLDPMAGRLVGRGYALDMEAMKAEGGRLQRERDAFAQREWEARLRAEDYNSACERHRIARQRRLNGYGTSADLEVERAFFVTYPTRF